MLGGFATAGHLKRCGAKMTDEVRINNVIVTAEADASLPSVEYIVTVENEDGEVESGFTFYVDDDYTVHLHRHPNTGAGLS